MSIIFALAKSGSELGLSAEGQEKVQHVFNAALRGLEHMRAAGARVGFGTDLLGPTYTQQCREFLIRREVFSPTEILRQATSVNAALLQLDGKLGCIKEGAFADILVVDGDPLSDVTVLAEDGRNIRVIMRAGELMRNELG
jgi:imidazolonepropionase-like amidohydrolase